MSLLAIVYIETYQGQGHWLICCNVSDEGRVFIAIGHLVRIGNFFLAIVSEDNIKQFNSLAKQFLCKKILVPPFLANAFYIWLELSTTRLIELFSSRLVLSTSRLVASISRLVPSISRLVPSISRLVPSISRLVPSISRLVPSISRLEVLSTSGLVCLSK